MEESSGRALTPKAWRTRERILGAALGLFADKGYEATTMRMWLGRRRRFGACVPVLRNQGGVRAGAVHGVG